MQRLLSPRSLPVRDASTFPAVRRDMTVSEFGLFVVESVLGFAVVEKVPVSYVGVRPAAVEGLVSVGVEVVLVVVSEQDSMVVGSGILLYDPEYGPNVGHVRETVELTAAVVAHHGQSVLSVVDQGRRTALGGMVAVAGVVGPSVAAYPGIRLQPQVDPCVGGRVHGSWHGITDTAYRSDLGVHGNRCLGDVGSSLGCHRGGADRYQFARCRPTGLGCAACRTVYGLEAVVVASACSQTCDGFGKSTYAVGPGERDVAVPTRCLTSVVVSVIESDCGFLARRVAVEGHQFAVDRGARGGYGSGVGGCDDWGTYHGVCSEGMGVGRPYGA